MTGKKFSAVLILTLALGLILAGPALARENRQPETPRASIQVPLALVGEEPVAPGNRIDFLTMRFELDGALYSAEELKRIREPISIVVDEAAMESGIARAYRSRRGAELQALFDTSCTNVTAESNTASCVFQDSLNCDGSWQRRVTVACGNIYTNISSFLTVRSFKLGCGWTRICGSGNCQSACSFYSGAAGTCYNVTSGSVHCAGCNH